MSRRGRGRVGGRAPILSDGDHSDLESARSPPRRPFLQAPPAPRMIPEKRFTRPSTAAVNIVSQSQKLSTIQRLPRTSNKRRFDMGAPQSAPGKLQKVRKNNLDSSNIRQNTYPIPNSPEPTSYPSRPVTNGLQAREGTWDTDQTYALQRADTIESETVINPEEVIAARAGQWESPCVALLARLTSAYRA